MIGTYVMKVLTKTNRISYYKNKLANKYLKVLVFFFFNFRFLSKSFGEIFDVT